jgi:ubiquinone/menaquinone biosynthesis C-methylase UbiE
MDRNKTNKEWFKSFFKKDFYNFDFIPKKRTQEEVSFIIKASGIKKGFKILDIPCGAARHSLELAKKKFDVTALDYSKEYLEDAVKKAQKTGLKNITFVRKDMRKIDFREEFDLAINMFTSFGYFDDKDNYLFLKKIYRSLKKGGVFIIDIKNGVFRKNNLSEKNWDIIGGLAFLPKEEEDIVYELAPYETISKEQYEEMVSKLPEIDYSRLIDFELDDETNGAKEYACVGDKCEIV